MDNIGDILKNLSQEDIENLQNAAKEIFGENSDTDISQQDSAGDLSSFLNPDVISKVSSLMSMMNKSDKRCDLISALKPNLSKSRQKKADEAIEMIKLLDILPMLGDLK